MTLPRTIDEYLDRLLDALRTDGKTSRRALAEVEDHLRSSADEKAAAGISDADAEHEAIAAFGYPEQVAGQFNREWLPGGSFAPAIQLALAGMLLCGIIFVSIGISGGVAASIGAAFGHDQVAQALHQSEMSPERCADFMRLVPSAADCPSAGLEHHYEEIVGYRLSAGVLGVLTLISYFLLRRFWLGARGRSVLPAGTGEAMGLAAFAVATAVLGFAALLDGNFSGNNGPGELLSAGAVAAVFLAGYTVMFIRSLMLRRTPLRETRP